MRGLGAVLAIACALGFAGAVPAAGSEAPTVVPGELLVRFQPGAPQARILDSVGGSVVERLSVRGLVRVRLSGKTIAAADAALERVPEVIYAQPNHRYEFFRTPNDPLFGQPGLWGLHQASDADIDAPEAWDITTGSAAVTVAIVDSGVEYTHPDLSANAWTNPGEFPVANALDDDGNGYVDDLRGWDFWSNDAAPLDEYGHGTHVAGTVGAHGDNGAGVVGVNWSVKLMPLRVGHETLSDSAVVGAFRYACAKGARVINGSFGGQGSSPAIHDAIAACPGSLFVFAAGNSSGNNDAVPIYPCGDPSPNVLCVAASAADDTLAPFSNRGATTVDLAAPGVGIASTYPGGAYATASGTSMATPHVAGVAALVWANRPTFTVDEVKRAVLLSVDPKPALTGLVATAGRLNAFRALGVEVEPPTGLTASSSSHTPDTWSNNSTADVSWGGATDASGIDGYSYSFSPDRTFVPDATKDVEENVTSLTIPLPDGAHWFHVRAVDGVGNWSDAVHVGAIQVDTFPAIRPLVSSPSHRAGGVSADPTIDVAWSGAGDAASGVDGYSFAWGRDQAVTPDAVKEAEETTARTTSARLVTGSWWFSIRVRDNAGNWTDTVAVGPFSIRTGPTACAVPRLRGLTLVRAKRVLAKRGCALGRITRAHSRRVARGRVIAQRPRPGLRLRRGARVRVVLSRGRRR